jgi:cytoskeletal protein RodZ
VGQFGDKFRKAREKKGISLDDVSNVTKISARMLQAIEEEHFDQLPGGVFNKGFIRAYARHVGLNDEEAVNEYLACLRQAQIDAQAVWEPNAGSGKDKRPQLAAHQIAANQAVASKVSHGVGKSEGGQPPTAEQTRELADLQLPRIEHVQSARRFGQRRSPLPWRPVVIALLLLVTVAVLWQRRMRHARAEGAGISTSPTAPASPSSPSVPTPVSQASPSPPTQKAAAQPHAAPAAKLSVASNLPGGAAAVKPAGNPAHTADQTSDQADDSVRTANQATAKQADDSASVPDAASAAPVSKTPARFRLVIHADENSWISVTADGQPVSHETLIAPADASFRGSREIVARIGNAAGVSFVWNGQEFQPQGAEAEVKTFVFDENGMHEVSSAPAPTEAH